jgi:hypothetical protein
VIWRVLTIALVGAATLYLARRILAAAERVAVATTLVPAAFGTALLVLATLLRADPLGLLQPIGSAAATVLLLFAAACWLTALVVAVVVGVVDGMAESVLPVRPLLPRRRPPARRTAAGGIVERIGSVAEFTLQFALYLLAQAGVLATNLLWFVLVVCVRRLVVSARWFARLVRDAAVVARQESLATVRVVLVPLLALLIAAWAAVRFADRIGAYMVTDSLAALGWGVGAAVTANLLLFLTWALLCAGPGGQPLASSAASFAHTLRVTTPYWLLLQAGGGWLIGLPAMFGYGNTRVGWATYASTAVLVGSFAVYVVTRRKSEPAPA